jgi:hypothetical protein
MQIYNITTFILLITELRYLSLGIAHDSICTCVRKSDKIGIKLCNQFRNLHCLLDARGQLIAEGRRG